VCQLLGVLVGHVRVVHGENIPTPPLLARSSFFDRIDTTKQIINGIAWILLDAATKFGGEENVRIQFHNFTEKKGSIICGEEGNQDRVQEMSRTRKGLN